MALEVVLKKTERSRGFHPGRCGSPNAITLERVIRLHHAKRRGGQGGQALSPLPYHLCFYFISR